jgi:hypothetical protein
MKHIESNCHWQSLQGPQAKLPFLTAQKVLTRFERSANTSVKQKVKTDSAPAPRATESERHKIDLELNKNYCKIRDHFPADRVTQGLILKDGKFVVVPNLGNVVH